MGEKRRSFFLILTMLLFVVSLFLPAANFEVVFVGWMAYVIGYFSSGILFWPSHLLFVLGWGSLARRRQRLAATCGICALYGPILFLWRFGGVSFPAGWVWLASILLLILGSMLTATSASD
jgi:hypothetical protein